MPQYVFLLSLHMAAHPKSQSLYMSWVKKDVRSIWLCSRVSSLCEQFPCREDSPSLQLPDESRSLLIFSWIFPFWAVHTESLHPYTRERCKSEFYHRRIRAFPEYCDAEGNFEDGSPRQADQPSYEILWGLLESFSVQKDLVFSCVWQY